MPLSTAKSRTLADKEKRVWRVRRICGQVEAVAHALNEEQDCSDVLQLITAAHGAMNSLIIEVLEGHAARMMKHRTEGRAARLRRQRDVVESLMARSWGRAALTCLLVAALLSFGISPTPNLPSTGAAESHTLVLSVSHVGSSLSSTISRPDKPSVRSGRTARIDRLYTAANASRMAEQQVVGAALEAERRTEGLPSEHGQRLSTRAPPQIASSHS
jgi:DNA-binding FrmR family transcriptional regulator